MIYEWDVPFTLTSNYGTLEINEAGDSWPKFLLAAEACDAGWDPRVTKDNIPAASGSILRKRYATGAEVTLAIEPWENEDTPACGSLATTMMDELRGHLWALLHDTDDSGRLSFVPEGKDARMLDDCRLLEIPRAQLIDNIRTRQAFTLDSPFPYLIDLTQTAPEINSTTDTLTNGGTADFWPVLKVYDLTSWTVTHNDLGVSLSFDDSRPGAGSLTGTYIEIDMFRNTAFVDGDQADAMPGIVIETSDFFPLSPGANSITTDASVTFLLNDAWA